MGGQIDGSKDRQVDKTEPWTDDCIDGKCLDKRAESVITAQHVEGAFGLFDDAGGSFGCHAVRPPVGQRESYWYERTVNRRRTPPPTVL